MDRFAVRVFLSRCFAASFISFLIVSTAPAQITNVTGDQSPPIPGAGHDYIHLLNETVNPVNGSLSIRVSVPTPSGRGPSMSFNFGYDSNQAIHFTPQSGWTDNVAYLSQGGWSYVTPRLTSVINAYCLPPGEGGAGCNSLCFWFTDYMLTDLQGGSHALGISPIEEAGQPGVAQCTGTYAAGMVPKNFPVGGDAKVQATTGSFSAMPIPGNSKNFPPPVSVADMDGTVYYFSNRQPENAPNGSLQSFLPDWIEDRNGNKIVFADKGNGVFTATDTLGRTLLSSSGFGTANDQISVAGISTPYQVVWETVSPTTFPIPIPFNRVVFNALSTCGTDFRTSEAQPPYPAVKQISLPNGQSYKFQYDPATTMLSKLTYPTGGYVRYVWGTTPLSEFSQFNACGGVEEQYGTLAVLHRYVSFDGTNEVLQQDFSYSTHWVSQTGNPLTWDSKTTTVTTTVRAVVNGTLTTLSSYKTVYTYVPLAVPTPPNDQQQLGSGSTPVETSVQYDDANGAPIRTVSKTYISAMLPPTSESTSLANGQTSQTARTYSSPLQSLLTDQYDYDYGAASSSGTPGPLLRHSHFDYASFNSPLFPNASSYPTSPVPSIASILDRPADVITYDGTGNKIAETDYAYDGTTVSSVSPAATGHDETNYSSNQNVRGNATTKTVKCLQTGCPNAVTTYTYDETGQVTSEIDPCGNGTCSDMTGATHTTTYSYADSYTVLSSGQNVSFTPSGNTNAYLTQITDALNHTSNFTYDFNNGELTASQDQNDINASRPGTTYLYNDPFARPKQINYPDGGLTSIAYNDSPFNAANNTPSVTTTRAITSTVNEVSTTARDGMGHAVKTILSSDPDGTTFSVTTYDGTGKQFQMYNPTRCSPPTTNCGSETTWGITTYIYDSLGRTTQVTKPDGSKASTSYSGNQTTVTDEVGNQRTSQTDGLGRLTLVKEAPNSSGYNFETDYQYDALNNLICAVQKGTDTTAFTNCASASANWRPRSFVYDSLSRLTSATNPESGTITYSYDLNGNLATRVEPKANTTGTAQTTSTYSYDALNRLLSKVHADPINANSFYGYDGTAITSCPGPVPPSIVSPTNLVGRRSGMCAIQSASSWSYDPMGRPLAEMRANIGPPIKKLGVGYTYYKDGSPNTLTYPSGNVIAYTVGGAGRVTQVSDSANNYVGYSGNFATYAPTGSLAGMTNGHTSTFAGIVTTNTYNNRLQPISLLASVSSNPITSLCYDFHLGVAVNSSPCSFTSSTTGDNGNVFQVVDKVDSTRSAAFTYDPLNRISQANTITTTGANCWGEVYTVDAWGNLTNRAGVSSMTGCSTEPLNAAPATSKNQLNGFSYDVAGNVTNDGNGNQPTYDAENRIATDAGVNYFYDADGSRMEKSSGTMYWLAGSEVLAETNLAGTINEEYVYFNGARIARVDRPSGAVHYYLSDHLGSASVITDASGNVQQRYYYYPYGGIVSSIGSDTNHYKFTGKERDTESNFDEFGARYYASNMGRFMTPDWAARATAIPYAIFGDPQTLNLYTYVENAPLNRVDADGHDDCPGGKVGSAGSDGHCITVNGSITGQNVTNAQNTTLQKAEGALDTFNGTLGFKQTNCAGGGDCLNALGMAGTAILTAVVSDGASEEGVVEKQVATASAKIERIAGRLTEETLDAANREVNGGMKVAKAGGGEFSHVEKVEQLMNGLDKQARHLERVLGRSGLSESQVGKINGVIERARGLLGIAREAITKDPI